MTRRNIVRAKKPGFCEKPGFWRRPVARRLRPVVLCLLLTLLLPSDGYLGAARAGLAVRKAVAGQQFELAAWEVQAVGQKLRDAVDRPGAELSEQAQHDLVVAYFDAISRIDQLQADIAGIFADPAHTDPAQAAAAQQAELDAVRVEQEQRRPAVERILEQQVAAVLSEQGLPAADIAWLAGPAGGAGHVWPPIRFQFTESPNYLIISPRDRIAVERGVYLDPTMPTGEMERIEGELQTNLNISALVDGTGGFSSYPTMVMAYASVGWVSDTIAHEWLHTYLMFRPLGWNYDKDGRMRTINETVCSIVGGEVGQRVLERFYPERVGPAAWPRPLSMRPSWLGHAADPDDFEFGAFMRATRLEVDRLLAEARTHPEQGRWITEAETTMEARRRELVDRGYMIRKLNQAYFAFHGSYATGPAATDPIGGKLHLLRQRAGSLAAFVRTVARFDDAADLDAALQ